jgi:hypothetical protein
MGRIGAVDIDLIGLSVQAEEDRLVSVPPVDIVGQFDYHSFCHGSIMAERNGLSEFFPKNMQATKI